MTQKAAYDFEAGKVPVFTVMDFDLHFPRPSTPLCKAHHRLLECKDYRYDELREELKDQRGDKFDQNNFMFGAQVGDNRWFGLNRYIIRVR